MQSNMNLINGHFITLEHNPDDINFPLEVSNITTNTTEELTVNFIPKSSVTASLGVG